MSPPRSISKMGVSAGWSRFSRLAPRPRVITCGCSTSNRVSSSSSRWRAATSSSCRFQTSPYSSVPRSMTRKGTAWVTASVQTYSTPSLRARAVAFQAGQPGQDLRVHVVELLMHVGDLQLGFEVDLVLDVVADALAGDLAVLAEEHEDREDDGLEGDRHGEEAEGEGIEAADLGLRQRAD